MPSHTAYNTEGVIHCFKVSLTNDSKAHEIHAGRKLKQCKIRQIALGNGGAGEKGLRRHHVQELLTGRAGSAGICKTAAGASKTAAWTAADT